MMTLPDFTKKQIVFVFANGGEKISLLNSNLIVKDKDGNVKLQCTCFRLFAVYLIGHTSITTPLIQEAKKFGFFFLLFSPSFRLYAVIGAEKDGNTLLKEKQYQVQTFDIARHLTKNKMAMQIQNLQEQRDKSDSVKAAIDLIRSYYKAIDDAYNLNALMAYEGLASKVYFAHHFNNLLWQGRKPRIKRDWINSTLDIGYTVLFSFVEALLSIYGFDLYCGVLHRQFYMRKSLVCDLVEPFRPIIDKAIKKGYNLREIKADDFTIIRHQYQLKWEKSPQYVSLFMHAILNQKEAVFEYIQRYYRCFMKQSAINEYPFFLKGTVKNGSCEL